LRKRTVAPVPSSHPGTVERILARSSSKLSALEDVEEDAPELEVEGGLAAE